MLGFQKFYFLQNRKSKFGQTYFFSILPIKNDTSKCHFFVIYIIPKLIILKNFLNHPNSLTSSAASISTVDTRFPSFNVSNFPITVPFFTTVFIFKSFILYS